MTVVIDKRNQKDFVGYISRIYLEGIKMSRMDSADEIYGSDSTLAQLIERSGDWIVERYMPRSLEQRLAGSNEKGHFADLLVEILVANLAGNGRITRALTDELYKMYSDMRSPGGDFLGDALEDAIDRSGIDDDW